MQGGMDIHGKLLSEGLADRGHSVSIISTLKERNKTFEERNGVNIYYLNNTVYGSRRKGWHKESSNKLFQLHNERPLDIVWSQSFDAFGLASFNKTFFKVPVVTILHGCMQQELKSFAANFFNRSPREIILTLAGLFMTYLWVQRRIISYSDKIIAVSREVFQSFEQIYGKTFRNKCVVIENGVDTKFYCPNEKYRAEVRMKYGVHHEDLLILAIGRITREKGFHIALEAVRYLIQQKNIKVKFIIAGSGEYFDKLNATVHQWGLEKHVIFTGHVENVDTVRYYNASDIVLNPSSTAEGSSLVILEAMSCGKPVIASGVGGINSIIIDVKTVSGLSPEMQRRSPIEF